MESQQTCVFVVDDDYDIRSTVTDVLELRGYRVGGAADGQEALDRLRAGLRPCLILLDLMMPGMNGWEFREAQARDLALSRIPVVIFSGAGAANVELHRVASAAAGLLHKPLQLDALLSTVARFCHPTAD
jgi:CheY-like chemotaxis protein